MSSLAYGVGMRRKKHLHLKRETVDRLIREVVIRAGKFNRRRHAYFVHQLVLFGSAAAGKERPGDVDVAVQLTRRALPDKTMERLEAEAEARAPTGVGGLRAATWASEEAIRFLKAGSRGLSLHNYVVDKQAVEAGLHRVIFRAKR